MTKNVTNVVNSVSAMQFSCLPRSQVVVRTIRAYGFSWQGASVKKTFPIVRSQRSFFLSSAKLLPLHMSPRRAIFSCRFRVTPESKAPVACGTVFAHREKGKERGPIPQASFPSNGSFL